MPKLKLQINVKIKMSKFDIAAKRHKIHKNNNLHIGISNSYGRQKYEFGLFTRPSKYGSNRFVNRLTFSETKSSKSWNPV